MARPACEPKSRVPSVRLALVAGVALVLVLCAPDPWTGAVGARTFGGAGASPDPFGTRPPPLDRAARMRIVDAFGVRAEPERSFAGWEAEDDVRSLYVTKTPSAWYVQFSDASALLGPPGDRSVICSAPDAPPACSVPEVTFVADAEGPPPTAPVAWRAARDVLERAGVLGRGWTSVVLDPGHDALPCPEDLESAYPCTRQRVPTRAVVFTKDFGPDAVSARWTVIVDPGGDVLSANGRIAVPA